MKDHRQNISPSDRKSLIAAVRMHLELEQAYGIESVQFRSERVNELRQKRPQAGPARSDKRAQLDALRRELEERCCCELGRTRTHLVFADGTPDADLMFVGEAPGYHEDMQGIPFVGPAGQLLTRIIAAIGYRRDEVYIANIVKCRPPNNRLPLPQEVAACLPYLRRQIEIVRPKIIVALGNLATQTLLQTTAGITKTRGIFVKWEHGIEIMPTFHPSYLLRNPAAKREVWDDMQKVWRRLREMGCKVNPLKTAKPG